MRCPGVAPGEIERPERLGYCPQLPSLRDKLTVAEHFELFTQAYGLDVEQAADSRDGLLAELGFGKDLDYRVEELSGGAGRSSTWPWRCCTTRSCCCSTSPTPALTGKPT